MNVLALTSKALAIATIFGTTSAIADTESVLVDADHLACLLENIEAYLGEEDDPLMVFLPLCPETSPSLEETLEFAENSSLLVIKESETESTTLSVVLLTKEQLSCLKESSKEVIHAVDEPASAVVLDFSECGVE